MDAEVYMIRCGTEAAAQAAVDRLCRLIGAEQTMNPTDAIPPGWVVRAVLRPPARTEDPQDA